MGLSECFYTSEELKVKSDFLPSTIWNAYTIQILRIQIYREHSPCLLPVHWKGLTGRCVNNKVQQSWTGAIEIHTSLRPCTEGEGLRVDLMGEVVSEGRGTGWPGYSGKKSGISPSLSLLTTPSPYPLTWCSPIFQPGI